MKNFTLISFILLYTVANGQQSYNLGSGNVIWLHSTGDANWTFGKDNNHNVNILGYGESARRFRVLNGTNSQELFNVNFLTGYVGIGTSSPSELLHISSSSQYPRVTIQSTNSSGAPGFDIRDNSGSPKFTWHYDIAGGFMGFFQGSGGGNKMVIKDDGKVGMSTTSPVGLLQVGDAAHASLTHYNQLISSGTGSGVFSTPSIRISGNTNSYAAFRAEPSIYVDAGVTLTNYYGIANTYQGGANNAGTITNAYGLYINKPLVGNNKYGAYIEGDVGVGTTTPNSALSVKGKMGIRADATPSAPTEALRVEGAIATEENVMNVTNLADQDFIVRLSGGGAGTKRTIIGPSVATRFSLGVGVNSGNEYLTIVNSGNVGIGTTSPQSNLEIKRDNASVHITAANAIDGGIGNPYLYINRISEGLKLEYVPNVLARISNTYNGSAGNMAFATSGQDRLFITGDGNIGIGTASPGSFKLAVNGKVWATEVQVALTNPGPDYVFEKDYKLLSLEDIKTYIDQHKHLPEVPSAKEMETNGVNVSEMNMLLLKKIEELTLYVIDMKKENEELKARVQKIENQK